MGFWFNLKKRRNNKNTQRLLGIFGKGGKTCLIWQCDQQRDVPRTWDKILTSLTELNSQGLLPDLSVIAEFEIRGVADPMEDGESDSMSVME